MNPDILNITAIICASVGIALGIATLIITGLRKRRDEEAAVAAAKADFDAAVAEQEARTARRKLEADRKAKEYRAAEEAARKKAEEAALRPVRALIEDASKNNAPRIHNERKRPTPAPKNTTSRTVNGRNETGYYDDSGIWTALAFNEIINHQYYESLREEQEAARPEPTVSEPEYSKTEYSTPEYSTPDYSSSSNDSSSSSSSSYDSGSSSSSFDGGSSGGGGDF